MSLAQTGGRPRFAAPTPHPVRRPRLSHPLAQVYTPDSPGGEEPGNASYISTASSHDLAVNERANASFDPTTDAGAKFNQVKLNAYLRGLNKHLIEENEALTMQLADLQTGDGGVGASPRSASMVSQGGAAASAALMSDLVAALQDELEQTKAERDDALAASTELDALRQRHEERAQDIVRLQHEIENAQSESRRRADVHASKVKQLTEGADAIVRETQAQLEDAQEQIATLQRRLEGAGKETERIKLAEEQADVAREAKLAAEQAQAKAEREAREIASERDALKGQVSQLEDRVEDLEDDLQKEKVRAADSVTEACNKIEEEQRRLRVALEADLAESQSRLAEQNLRIAALEEDLNAAEDRVDSAQAQVAQMNVAIMESEAKTSKDAEELKVLSRKVDTLVRERDLAESRAAQAKLLSNSGSRKVSGASTIASEYSATSTALSKEDAVPIEEHQRQIDDLEAQLEDAEREIGRLELAAKDSSSTQAINKARQLRIEALEKENAELNEKVAALRQALQPFADGAGSSTPIRGGGGTFKGTPQTMKRFSVFDKTMRTPGAAPFADVSPRLALVIISSIDNAFFSTLCSRTTPPRISRRISLAIWLNSKTYAPSST